MLKDIFLDEMRERVARLIFGDGWIRTLTDDECELLRAYPLVSRPIQRSDGSTIRLDHCGPVPRHLASKIDRARGRQSRLDAQWVTIDTWLQDHGLPVDPRRSADRKAFMALLRYAARQRQKRMVINVRPRGRPAQIIIRVVAEMQDEIKAGALTHESLASLPEKELTARFSCSRDRARAARTQVLSGRGR
jgi:hypothetical protein